MESDFGERQYEFAVNLELTNNLGAFVVGGVPRVPTTNEEASLGYDTLFNLGTGYLYHLQYKVSSYGARRAPNNGTYLAYHRGPYYRFALPADATSICRQHVKLEELRRHEPGVYYCAPEFHREDDFWSHAAAQSVFEHSALIDLEDVPLPSPKAPHAISYDHAGRVKVWSPEGEGRSGERDPQIRRRLPTRDISIQTFRRLVRDFVDVLAADPSIAVTVPRADRSSGVRTSIVDMRAPRPIRGERRPPSWRSQRDAQEAFAETPPDRDRTEAAELIETLDDREVIATAAAISALDFGLTTIVEPADTSR
jgi:hypothetical protein